METVPDRQRAPSQLDGRGVREAPPVTLAASLHLAQVGLNRHPSSLHPTTDMLLEHVLERGTQVEPLDPTRVVFSESAHAADPPHVIAGARGIGIGPSKPL